MGDRSRKLRWFERRLVSKAQGSVSFFRTDLLADSSLLVRALALIAAIFALSTLVISGYSIAIPPELRIFIDGYLLSNILFDTIVALAVSLLTARVLLPVAIFASVSVGNWMKSDAFRNALRATYAYSWRNGFHGGVYPLSVLVLTLVVFLFLSFGLALGALYTVFYILVVIAFSFILMLGDVLGFLIASKTGSWNKKLSAIDSNGVPPWFVLVSLAAILTVATFGFGYGVAMKRTAEIALIRTGDGNNAVAIIGVTSRGMLVKWSDKPSDDVGDFAFVPFNYVVHSSNTD